MIQKPPGIEDVFPDRIGTWNFVTGTARKIFKSYNYREIIIPIMEFTEVFARGIGTDTDIVSKEMFTFEDRGGRDLSLRPEGTAPVVRAYVENGQYNRLSSCKLFYVGPMFRAERPQRGRLRQFNQFGAELFGSGDPFYDYEIMAMVDAITRELGIKDYSLLVNSIGCPECRTGYIAELKKYYQGRVEELCDDCKKRLESNTLRLLDCKKEQCRSVRENAPIITDHLDDGCRDHYEQVKSYLSSDGIAFTEDPCLVRGLDYYTRTTFEFVSSELEGQNAFAAGGRYDNLVEQFDGNPTPAVGFAAGIERIILLLDESRLCPETLDVYIVHSGGITFEKARSVLAELRSLGISADMEPELKGFKAQMKRANRESALKTIIIGEDELAQNTVTVKDMESGQQGTVPMDKLDQYIRDLHDR